VLHLTPNWNVDVLLEAQRGMLQLSMVARTSPPPARIVDVQVINRGAVTSPAAERAKVVDRPASKRTPAQDSGPAEITRVGESYLASKLQGVLRCGIYAPYWAWLRAQEEAAQASIMASYLEQIDVYA